MTDPNTPLPMLVTVTQAFSARLPSQRVLDTLTRVESDNFANIAQAQPFRIVAFRALLRDFPDRDPSSLWLHAYDVEVEVQEPDPTSPNGLTPAPPLENIGG